MAFIRPSAASIEDRVMKEHGMNDGRLTILIGKREALPVRAIPYVTGWVASPGKLAKDLSQPLSKDSSRLPHLVAYHLVGGVPTVVAAREWDAVVVKLKAFETALKKQFSDHDLGYAEWRNAAAEQFPKDAFVWLDEFKPQFDSWREEQEFLVQRPGDNELILAPMLDEQVAQIVLEGFVTTPVGNSHLDIESKMNCDTDQTEGDALPEARSTELICHSQDNDGVDERESLPPGLTTSELISCFGGYMGVKNPAKVLSEYPVWTKKNGALLSKGRRGKPSKSKPDTSEWNPVQFALNLLEKIPLPVLEGLGELKQQHLDTVFSMKSLNQWRLIWGRSKPL